MATLYDLRYNLIIVNRRAARKPVKEIQCCMTLLLRNTYAKDTFSAIS
jgi:hypothetical protein